jgi:hypothetical protein
MTVKQRASATTEEAGAAKSPRIKVERQLSLNLECH